MPSNRLSRSRPSRWGRAAPPLVAGLLAAALADSALTAVSPPFSWQADLATAVGLAVVLTGGLVRLRGRSERAGGDPAPSTRAALAWWASIGGAAVSFELLNYFLSPRRQHPTLSSLVADLTSHEALRGLLFLLWLAAGWWIWWQP